jgi:hypothetical protein
MALPKLETPTYETVIPSTNRVIEYRPFLVKEEKILMMAQESQDPAQAITALKKIIKACTFNKVDPNELTTYDAEFLFLQLRIKSVGETSEFSLPCDKCGQHCKVNVDLTEVEVDLPEFKPDNQIELGGGVGMTLKELSLADSVGVNANDMKDISSMVAMVIDTIYDKDQVYKTEGVSKKELAEFVDQLNHEQLEAVSKFIAAQPAIQKTIAFTCKQGECSQGGGHKTEITMRGLADFFA